LVNAGALGFVLKTSGKQEFEMAIRTIMQGGNYFSIEILRQIILLNSTPQPSKQSPKINLGLQLSSREKEVLLHLCKGFSVSEIAEKLFLSAKTIESHRSTLLKKTNTKNTINLVLYALKNQLAEI
jgi:DNA-binding NarL/FixJ family response regulator